MTTFKRVRRFGSWVTFLVLEAFSLTLVVEYNQYQNQIFAHSANVVTGTLNKKKTSVFKYWSLGDENERLQAENARLRRALSAVQATTAVPDSSDRFPEALRERFEFIPARVINKTLLGQNNYFTIDRGARDSIVQHMGVIGDQGLIGIITNVSQHYAKVMTILHSQTRISASIKGQSYFGSLLWDGRKTDIMTLEDIPKIVDVSPGDTIITSGYSNIFPPNIVIGTVESSELKPGEGGRTISVKLINDLSSLTYAYVIKDRMASDLKKLEE